MEARCLLRFDADPQQTCFPYVEQAARLTRFIDRGQKTKEEVESEWLLTSMPAQRMSSEQMLLADRNYWGIENGLHLRLDVTAGEDRSRVSNPVSALNLAMIRRATTSLAVYWIQRCPNKRHATLRGFYDFMAANNSRKAFSLVSARKSRWLHPP